MNPHDAALSRLILWVTFGLVSVVFGLLIFSLARRR